MPPSGYDMKSVKEQGRPCDPADCRSWGLSVWLAQEAAEHARSLIPFFRKCYIVAISVGVNDGVLLHTPSNNQPGHYTFWKRHDVNLPEENIQLAIGPEQS